MLLSREQSLSIRPGIDPFFGGLLMAGDVDPLVECLPFMQETLDLGWRDDLMFRNPFCSCGGPRFDSR